MSRPQNAHYQPIAIGGSNGDPKFQLVPICEHGKPCSKEKPNFFGFSKQGQLYGRVVLTRVQWTRFFVNVLAHPFTKEKATHQYLEHLKYIQGNDSRALAIMRDRLAQHRGLYGEPLPVESRKIFAGKLNLELGSLMMYPDPENPQGYWMRDTDNDRFLAISWEMLSEFATYWLRDHLIEIEDSNVSIPWGVTRANPGEAFLGSILIVDRNNPQSLPVFTPKPPDDLALLFGLVKELRTVSEQLPETLPEGVTDPLGVLKPTLATLVKGLTKLGVIPADLSDALGGANAKAKQEQAALDAQRAGLQADQQKLATDRESLAGERQANEASARTNQARAEQLDAFAKELEARTRALFAEIEADLLKREAAVDAGAKALDEARNGAGTLLTEIVALRAEAQEARDLIALSKEEFQKASDEQAAVQKQKTALTAEEKRLEAQRLDQDGREFRLRAWESQAGEAQRKAEQRGNNGKKQTKKH